MTDVEVLLTGDHLPAYAHPGDAGADLIARETVVLGPGDCESGLGFIHLASQRRFRNMLSVTGILVGSPADTRIAQQRLRARGYAIPLHARSSGPRAAEPIGYRSTPYLLLLDESGRVRFAADVPVHGREMRAIEQAIRSIVLPPDHEST